MSHTTGITPRVGPLIMIPNRLICWAYGLVFMIFFRRRIIHTTSDRLPWKGGVLIVSNHQSHFDPPLVGTSILRPVRFLARRTLGNNFIMRMVFRIFGLVPVERDGQDREAFRIAVELLKANNVVCIFPEGTRSEDGKLQPFKKGGELMARRAGVPIMVMAVRGTFECWPKGQKFPRLGRVELLVGRLIPVAELKAGGVDLHAEIAALLEKA